MDFDFIKPDALCIYDPNDDWGVSDREWHDPIVVRIGKYNPYYTDGEMPDPKSRDEWEETMRIEVYHDNPHYDCQIPLYALHEIEPTDLTEVLVGDEVRTDIIGEWCGYIIVGDKDDLANIVVTSDYCAVRHIEDLSLEELLEFYGQISVGSIYISDYRNSFGVPPREASDASDSFEQFLCAEYGDNDADNHYNAQEFAEYVFDSYC